jgi:large subunit ribosomal protein L21
MYAVLDFQGRQYRVEKGMRLKVERINKKEGSKLKLNKVLLFSDGKKINIGQPYLKDVIIDCEIVSQIKDKKKIAFKYRRRKSSQAKRGHRQKLTLVEVKEIKYK